MTQVGDACSTQRIQIHSIFAGSCVASTTRRLLASYSEPGLRVATCVCTCTYTSIVVTNIHVHLTLSMIMFCVLFSLVERRRSFVVSCLPRQRLVLLRVRRRVEERERTREAMAFQLSLILVYRTQPLDTM